MTHPAIRLTDLAAALETLALAGLQFTPPQLDNHPELQACWQTGYADALCHVYAYLTHHHKRQHQ